MRVRVDDPVLLRDLCDFLSRRGCVAVEVTVDGAEVLIPGAASSFQAAAMLMSEVGIWRVKHQDAKVAIDDG